MRILLADRDAERRAHTLENLGKLGHTAFEASDAASAILIAQHASLDLTLVDLELHGGHAPFIQTLRNLTPGTMLVRLGGQNGAGSEPSYDLHAPARLDASALLSLLRQVAGLQKNSPERLLLDESTLKQRFSGDDELLKSVLQMYLEDAPDRMETMREALVAENLAEAAKAAHSLKGISGSVGCLGLAEAALDMERAGRDGDAAALDSLMTKAAPLLAETLAQVRQLLARLEDGR